MRVLLVEDDVFIADSLIDSLEEEAYAVDWAKDGREAILTLKVESYDVILLDLGLPCRVAIHRRVLTIFLQLLHLQRDCGQRRA